MQNLIFISIIGIFLSVCYSWAFRYLPRERWQIFATVPVRRHPDGQWQGLNLTYYGLFNACATVFALIILIILLTACSLPPGAILINLLVTVGVFAPFAKWTALWVEKKKHTLSIGGASFCGLVASPALFLIIRQITTFLGYPILPLMHLMGALAIGYTFGEGIGRLACLSFGCCYGKPVSSLPRPLKPFFAPFSVVFQGATKKVAYADNLTGQKIVAIQSLTASLYSGTGLLGTYLFLQGQIKAAYLVCIVITQLWRIVSEFMRADYRGDRQISIYQYMAGCAILISFFYTLILPEIYIQIDLFKGLLILWNPVIILTCQIFWFVIFLFTGRSKMTAARIDLFVHPDQI